MDGMKHLLVITIPVLVITKSITTSLSSSRLIWISFITAGQQIKLQPSTKRNYKVQTITRDIDARFKWIEQLCCLTRKSANLNVY